MRLYPLGIWKKEKKMAQKWGGWSLPSLPAPAGPKNGIFLVLIYLGLRILFFLTRNYPMEIPYVLVSRGWDFGVVFFQCECQFFKWVMGPAWSVTKGCKSSRDLGSWWHYRFTLSAPFSSMCFYSNSPESKLSQVFIKKSGVNCNFWSNEMYVSIHFNSRYHL